MQLLQTKTTNKQNETEKKKTCQMAKPLCEDIWDSTFVIPKKQIGVEFVCAHA